MKTQHLHTLQCFIAAKVDYIQQSSDGEKQMFDLHFKNLVRSPLQCTGARCIIHNTVNIKSMQLCND